MTRSNSHRRDAAFTLVELLVVIGIIAVLISILLPALNRSRSQAKVVQCASLMRQIVLATRTYAAENKDSLPALPHDYGQPTYNIRDSGGTQPTVRAFNYPYDANNNDPYSGGSAAGNEDRGLERGAGIGRLVFGGYMKGNVSTLSTCPNNAEQDRLQYGGYDYMPHLAIRTYGGAEYWQPWWKKAAAYGRVVGPKSIYRLGPPYDRDPAYNFPAKKWSLLTDPLLAPSTGSVAGFLPHKVSSNYVVNLATIDGAVIPVYSKKDRGNANGYQRFNDLLTYLELLAENSTGGSTFPNNTVSVLPINP